MKLQSRTIKRGFLLSVLLLVLAGLIGAPVSAQMDGFSPVDGLRTWNLSDYEAETGMSIASLNEAPELAEQVAAGALPPLEERLPVREDIVVVQPREGIGQYGGEIRFNATNPNSFGNTGWSAWEQHLTGFSTNWEVVFPQIAKSIENSEDNTVWTVTLRRGMRWSDGAPLTTADTLFWYQDIMLNPELPNLPSQLAPGGNRVVIEAIDDYTMTFTFAVPYPAFPLVVATGVQGVPFAPRHYLEQFHIAYNENATADATDAGYNTWVDAFIFHYDGQSGDNHFDPNLPVLKPWTLDRVDEFGNKFYRRNPYYWKVDTEGNQLPYINSQVRLLLSDPEVVKLNIQSGEIDYGYYGLSLTDLPLLRASEAQGDYTTILWPADQGAMLKFQFNITVSDPVLNEIFNDLRFRQAMSLAINRQEINEVLYFGLARPRQWGVSSASPFYEDWMADYYAEYDPERAGELLDEMGLTMGADGVRMRPDRQPLNIVLWDAINRARMVELVSEYWQDIGVGVTVNTSTREAFQQALIAGEAQASVWFADVVAEINMYLLPIWFRPPYGVDTAPVGGGFAWWRWWQTGGAEGEEPSDPFFLEQLELVQQFQLSARGSEQYQALGSQIVTRTLERMYHIGTVGEAPEVFVRANRLRNFPPVEGTVYISHLASGHSDQWYVTE